MNCTQFDDIAELYLLDELDAATTAAAEQHLASCERCRAAAQAAGARLRALEAALAPRRAPDGFAERAMARIRAEAAPAEPKDRPETLRSRLLRYAALAAAAVLLVMAAYGFLRRSGYASWLESGTVAVLGPHARTVGPNQPLIEGDELATPDHSSATLALAGGRLRVALAPRSRVRLTDPRTGTALQLLSGEMYCRSLGGEGTPMVASPLANVAAGPGVVSLQVTPERGAPLAPASPFQGIVTVAAPDGTARVVVPGRQAGPVPLERGQVLTLSSDQRHSLTSPVPFDRLRQLLQAELRSVRQRHGELEHRWNLLASGSHANGGQLPARFGELQDALAQTRALHGELEQRLRLIERCQTEGPQAFRLVFQPLPSRPIERKTP